MWIQPCAGLGGSLCPQQHRDLQLETSCGEGSVELLHSSDIGAGAASRRSSQAGWAVTLRCDRSGRALGHRSNARAQSSLALGGDNIRTWEINRSQRQDGLVKMDEGRDEMGGGGDPETGEAVRGERLTGR